MMERHTIMFNNIQRLAYEQGLTISGLCEKAKIRRSVLFDLKYGKKQSLTGTTMQKLCDVLLCNIEDITTESRKNDPIPDRPKRKPAEFTYEKIHQELSTRPDVRRLMRAAMDATDKQVRATAILLESIVDGTLGSGDDE